MENNQNNCESKFQDSDDDQNKFIKAFVKKKQKCDEEISQKQISIDFVSSDFQIESFSFNKWFQNFCSDLNMFCSH
jgi:hypothetical protein